MEVIDDNWFSCGSATSFFANGCSALFFAGSPAQKEAMSPLTIHQLMGRKGSNRFETDRKYLCN